MKKQKKQMTAKNHLNFSFLAILFLTASLSWFLPPQALANKPQNEQTIKQVPTIESLRLTHALYQLTLGEFFTDNRKQYQVEFLAHEKYLQVFLKEWHEALQQRKVRSTREYFETVKQKPSFLGKFFNVWIRIHAGGLKDSDRKERIDLGQGRAEFLLDVLRSEAKSDFSVRTELILNSVAQHLATNDPELALSIATAFQYHPDLKTKTIAFEFIQKNPQWQQRIAKLQLARDLALGIVMGPTIGLPKASIALGKGIQSTVKLLYPKELISRLSLLTKAGAVSAAGHVGVLAYAADSKARAKLVAEGEASRKIDPFFTKPTGEALFVTLLAVSGENAIAVAGKAAKDFSVSESTLLKKQEWIDQGNAYLSGAVQKIDFRSFILNGEALAEQFGAPAVERWPKESALTMALVSNRLSRARAVLQKVSVGEIDAVRQAVIEDTLVNYRKQVRTLTGLYLEWGGNCVAQTLEFVGSLLERPELIPKGYQLGFALVPMHMEAVLLSETEILFLMSGERVPRTEPITVLSPKALVYTALATYGALSKNQSKDLASFYLSGMPDENNLGNGFSGISLSFEHVVLLGAAILEQVRSRLSGQPVLEDQSGMVGSISQFFKRLGANAEPTDIDSVPNYAKQKFNPSTSVRNYVSGDRTGAEGRRRFSVFDAFKAGLTGREGAREKPALTVERTVQIAGKTISICLTASDFLNACGENMSFNKYLYLSGQSSLRISGGRENQKIGYDGPIRIAMRKTESEIVQLMTVSPELWLWVDIATYLQRSMTKTFKDSGVNIDALGAETLQRAKNFALADEDAALLKTIFSSDRYPDAHSIGENVDEVFNDLGLSALLKNKTNSFLTSVSNSEKFEKASQTSGYIKLENLRKHIEDSLAARRDPMHDSYLQKELSPKLVSAPFYIVEFANVFFVRIAEDPANFMKAFGRWSPALRGSALRISQHLGIQKIAQYFVPLRDLMNKISDKQVQVEPAKELTESEERHALCLGFKVNLPTYGGVQEPWIRIHKSSPQVCGEDQSKVGRDEEDRKETRETLVKVNKNKMQIAADVLAELTLLSSGGQQLWQKDVLTAVQMRMKNWVAAGYEVNTKTAMDAEDVKLSFPIFDELQIAGSDALRKRYLGLNDFVAAKFYENTEAGKFKVEATKVVPMGPARSPDLN